MRVGSPTTMPGDPRTRTVQSDARHIDRRMEEGSGSETLSWGRELLGALSWGGGHVGGSRAQSNAATEITVKARRKLLQRVG